MKYLSTKKFGCTATLDKRKRRILHAVENANKTLKSDESIFRRCDNIVVLAYKDKNVVRAISNMHRKDVDMNGKPLAICFIINSPEGLI